MVANASTKPKPVVELLTPEAVAVELKTATLGVHRLIARRGLPAGRIGTGDPPTWRVDSGDLRDYVAKHCPDLDLPRISDAGWILPPLYGNPVHSQREMNSVAVEEQRLTPEAVEALREQKPGARSITVDLKVTSPVMQIWRRPLTVPAVAKGQKPAKPSPIRTVGDEILATELLRHLHAVIGREPKQLGTGAAERLYQSPDDYARFISTAIAEMLASRLPATVRETVALPKMRIEVETVYSFPVKALAAANQLQTLARAIL